MNDKPFARHSVEVEDPLADIFDIRDRPPYHGAYTTREYPGALRNGTRVVKTNTEPVDTVQDGTPGTVLGSFGGKDQFAYYVEWDSLPLHAILVVSHRVKPQA